MKRRLLGLSLLSALTAPACFDDPGPRAADDGALGFQLDVGTSTLATASYVITGPGDFTRSAAVDVSRGTTLAFNVCSVGVIFQPLSR